jgi:hypothetical protein
MTVHHCATTVNRSRCQRPEAGTQGEEPTVTITVGNINRNTTLGLIGQRSLFETRLLGKNYSRRGRYGDEV